MFALSMKEGKGNLRLRASAELFCILGLCIVGMAMGLGIAAQTLSFVLDIPFRDTQNFNLLKSLGSPGRIGLLCFQGFVSLAAFVAFPSLIFRLMPGKPFEIGPFSSWSLTLLGLVLLLALLMMPVNAWLGAWNAGFQFPPFMKGISDWLLEKDIENQARTLFLVQVKTPLEYFLAFFVISVLAGICEEYFFRKLIQPRIFALTNNMHAAIWITAFIFSAIHFQFSGLLPRMALGALFGYYFWWTGNIWISILAHSLNNAITLIGLFLYQNNLSSLNVEDPKQIPWYLGAIAAGVTWSLASMVKEEAEKRRFKPAHVLHQIPTKP